MADRFVEYMRLDEINTAERNPKLHDHQGIRRSIEHHGVGELPLLDERTDRLVAGHGRIAQLAEMHTDGQSPPDGVKVADDGMYLVPVTRGWSSRSDADAEAYLIGSNRLSENGGVDEHLMTEMLGDLAGDNLLDLTGYDEGDLAALEALYGAPEPVAVLGIGMAEDLDDELDELDAGLGAGKPQGNGMETLRLEVPPILAESWRAHLDTHSGDAVQAFAAALGVDMADVDLEGGAAQDDDVEPVLGAGADLLRNGTGVFMREG